ncbi:PhnB protein [Diaminobutyricimonas aerilata]|uniref:PhnB protein n=1 Tax=Diaminobutyricimonas aerilata TaxID=1162967 RepID=A0A2M9CKM9_9MICO|nr:VOC family protein [Diaminobutyricimonas aerilata]PJJ72463.1 PhnB protein [Diaminobutyricimonas aerilata]
MTVTTTTHLNLPGTAREALEFYRDVFGGDVAITTYGELGMPADLPDAGRVVFGRLDSPSGFHVLAYDVPGASGTDAGGSTTRRDGLTFTDRPFFLSVSGETLEEVAGYWDGLAAGAAIIEPLAASAWSAGFGMLTDRFGVTWVLDVVTPAA